GENGSGRDGNVNAFDAGTGDSSGPLIDPEGNPLTVNGLWALQFSNGAKNDGSSRTCSLPQASPTSRTACSVSARPAQRGRTAAHNRSGRGRRAWYRRVIRAARTVPN